MTEHDKGNGKPEAADAVDIESKELADSTASPELNSENADTNSAEIDSNSASDSSSDSGSDVGSGADSVETSDASVSEKAVPSDEPVIKNKSRSSLLLILLLIFIILAAAIAGAGYWFWGQYQQDINAMRQVQQETQAQITANQKAFERVEQISLTANEDWRSAVSDLEAIVVSSAQRLNRQANRSEYRWPLEEALTLTRLAQQRLQLDASARVAIGLLQTADEILAGLDQAAVLPLRRQLAEDILALQTTRAADVNGLYFQLEAISGDIQNLNWQPRPANIEPISEDANPAEGFWQSLKQIVVVTKMDVPRQASPLLTDFEQWRQNQLLLVEQTQLALLAHNQLLFDAALQQSIDSLSIMSSQFDLSVLNENLVNMSQAVLNPQWPQLNASVEIIEQYLAEQDAVEKAPVEQEAN